jgi:ABC-type lipoprotein export system ATPase subunit
VEERKTSLILVTHDPTIASHGDIKVRLEKGKFIAI